MHVIFITTSLETWHNQKCQVFLLMNAEIKYSKLLIKAENILKELKSVGIHLHSLVLYKENISRNAMLET